MAHVMEADISSCLADMGPSSPELAIPACRTETWQASQPGRRLGTSGAVHLGAFDMQHFVVYHNPDVMGYPAIDVEQLAIYTNKRRSDAVGGRVWLITGEGTPRKYRLRSTFIVESVGGSEKPGFKARVTGREGRLFHPMPLLNTEAWFPQFLRKQGNFAFGFQPINDPVVEEGLLGLLSPSAG
jgi:hypothetical protein